jgi:aminoethylphosphonate catabolism LysR family transcriptional regulator
MSPTQARTFHAVATAGSLTGAAKALRVSQPTVTTQIRDLELLYGVELFHRHARGVTLTHTGQELLTIVRRIHANQQDAVEFLRATQGLQTGHLRVGAYGAYPAIRILAEFKRRHAKLDVSLHFANSQVLEEELLDHNLDVVVITHSRSVHDLHSLPFRRLSGQVAIVGKEHSWRRRKSIKIEELAGQPFVVREPGASSRQATEEVIAQSGGAPGKIIEVGSREGLLAAVAEGVGIGTIFDEGIVPDEMVVKLPITGADIVSEVDVVCLSHRKDSRIIAAFFAIAEEIKARDGA